MPVEIFSRPHVGIDVDVLREHFEALLRSAKASKAWLELRLVGEKAIQNLNRDYLHKNYVTDVLSFPLETKPEISGAPWHLGEIVIAVPVAKGQAKRAGRTLYQQIVRLGIHGLVHLQGHDHELGELERKQFEKLEKKYLKYLDRREYSPWDGSLEL